METGTKRKKKKTRRCLNEIKNKLRITENGVLSKNSGDNKFKTSKSKITTNRLTLSIFSKSIRSRTVTRPHLLEKRLVDMEKTLVKCSKNVCNDKSTHGIEPLPMHNLCERSVDPGINLYNSFIKLSPKKLTDVNLNSSQMIITPLSYNQPHEDNGCETYYEEFIKKIPLIMKDQAPVLHEEEMEEANSFINKKNNCYAFNSNLSQTTWHTKNRLEMTIVEHPMNYIRLAHKWQHDKLEKMKPYGCDSATFTPQYPSPCNLSSCSLPLIAISETPDYMYFPHKLNV